MADDSARDKAIDKLVSDRLRARREAPGAVCPDAEILAAYLERTLSPRERAGWETHFSGCARCQEQLGQLVKLGEADEAISAAAPPPARRKKLFGLRWAWAAPMLVAVLIGGIWYTGEFNRQLKQTSETATQLPAQAPVPSKAPETAATEDLKAELETRPTRQLETPKTLARADTSRNKLTRDEAAPPSSGLSAGQLRKAPDSVASTEPGGQHEEISTKASAAPVAAAPVLQPSPPSREDKEGSLGNIAPPSERSRLQAQTTDQPSQPKIGAAQAEAGLTSNEKSPAVEAGMAAGAQSRAETTAKSAENRNVLLKSQSLAGASNNPEFHYANAPSKIGTGFFYVTSPQYLWRVGPRGLIQKRGLENKWQTKPSGVDADLFDITFPSADAGWVVGHKGTILRTSDGGNTWNKTSSPTSDDIVRVKATSAQAAEILTRSGLVFVTSDGGDSWNASSHPQ